MEYDVHAVERSLQSVTIADVGADKLGAAVQEFRMFNRMNLRDQCIKNTNLVAAGNQCIHQMGADESRSACR